ncbi:MAG: hypothetical protein DMF10_05465 [Verrucomicrobia bacterium]|nr:MAG: hypothetical protein DMF10_05465 [Verrucomicrobiota bacterium]
MSNIVGRLYQTLTVEGSQGAPNSSSKTKTTTDYADEIVGQALLLPDHNPSRLERENRPHDLQ